MVPGGSTYQLPLTHGPTGLIVHGIWKHPAWALALWSLYRGWQDLPDVFARTAELSTMPSFGLMTAGARRPLGPAALTTPQPHPSALFAACASAWHVEHCDTAGWPQGSTAPLEGFVR